MKVRVKLSDASRTIDIGDGDQCTLGELNTMIAEVFHLNRQFSLSLNKRDAFFGDEQTVIELGIVPGDLLFVMTNETVCTLPLENVNNHAIAVDTPVVSESSSSSSNVSVEITGENSIAHNDTHNNGTPQNGDNFADLEAANINCMPANLELSLPNTETTSNIIVSATDSHMSQGETSNIIVSATDSHMSQGETTSTLSETVLSAEPFDHFMSEGVSLSSPPPSPSPLEDPEVNRCLLEPLLCREATPTAVPAVLQDLYAVAACRTPFDALWVVIHALMMEVGFRPAQPLKEYTECSIVLVILKFMLHWFRAPPHLNMLGNMALDSHWNLQGFYKCSYAHICVDTENSCTIIGVPMGSILVIHGLANGIFPFKTEQQQLRVQDFINVHNIRQDVHGVYRNLERLSRTVKDLICQPLLAHLGEVCGYPVSLGLMSLSHEIKFKVFSFLPASSLIKVGQVCREFNNIYQDSWLWRRLYLREFGRNGESSLSKDWYKMYKEDYLRRRERRKAAKIRHPVLSGIPPWLNPRPGHFPPLALPSYTGIIGGDYDVNPEFSSGIPHPVYGRLPGPFTHQPRYDIPFAPGFSPNLGQPFYPSPGSQGPRPSRPLPYIPFDNRYM